MSKKVRSLALLVLLYGMLAGCAEAQTPTPASNTPPVRTDTPAASPTPTGIVVNTTPPVVQTAPATSTTAPLASVPPASPTISTQPPPLVPTATPVPPTLTLPGSTSPGTSISPVGTLFPGITPGPNVPLLPVRRSSGTLSVGVLETDFKTRNYSPYAPGLSDVSMHLQRMVWNARLLYSDPVRLDWKTLAARSLPVVDNGGRRFTFNLREDLVWSDGSPITSADYIYAFNQAVRPENRYPWQSLLQHISRLDGPDLRTLIFTLDDTYSTAFHIINLLEPLPSRVWSKFPFTNPALNPEINRPSLTSGPFQPDAGGLNLQAQSGYPQGRPNFQSISIKLMKTRADLYDNLRSGQINWTLQSLPSGSYGQFHNLSTVSIYRWYPQDAASRYLGYNLNSGFLQARSVRQALNRLLDVRSLLATVENGLGTEQPGFLPVSNEYALKTTNPARFNIKLARDELKDAGFQPRDEDSMLADLDGKPVSPLELLYPENSTEAETIVQYIVQQYQQAGLKVIPVKLEAAALQKRLSDGKYDLELGTLVKPGASDPDDYQSFFTTRGVNNYSGYSNSQVDKLFAAGPLVPETDQKAVRRQLYESLQRQIADDSPLFFLYTLQAYTVMSAGIDPGGAGVINLSRWQLAWDAFPAYLNWYVKDSF